MSNTGFSLKNENRSASSVWMLVSFIMATFVLYGLFMTVAHGESTHGTSANVPWGILISAYVFFVVSSTGLCLVSSLGHVFGLEKFEVIAKRSIVLAIITLLCGFIMIGLELGHPFRMLWIVLSPNFASGIWWMGTLYSVYLVFICIEFFFLMKKNYQGAAAMGLGGFIAGIAAHSNLGAVFAFMDARPFWSGPYLPIYFILSALVSGSALVIIIMNFGYAGKLSEKAKDALTGVSKLFGLFLGITMFFYFWKITTSLYSNIPGKTEAAQLLVSGSFALKFWVFEVLLGMLIPFIMILATKGNSFKASLWASVSAMIGIFFMRYSLVITGQVVPDAEKIPGITVYAQEITKYSPTFVELSIVIGGIGIAAFLYLLAERVFDLNSETH